MKTIRMALSLLTREERWRALGLMALMTTVALFDVLGMASVMPFLSVVANPDMIETNSVLNQVYTSLGFTSTGAFLSFLGFASFALLVVSAGLRMLGLYAVNRFALMRTHSIGHRLFETYLRQPYAFFLNRHTGDMAKELLSEVFLLVSQVYQPAAQLVAQTVTLGAMLVLLILIDPVVAAIMVVVLGGAYAAIFLVVRRFVGRAGQERADANQARFKVVTEALGGIKPVKLLGREPVYLDSFSRQSWLMVHYQSINTTLSQAPKFAIEAVAFGGIILLTLGMMARFGGHESGALGKVLPLLGLYAFAGYRLLPAVQGIYASVTQLRFGAPALYSVHKDLEDYTRLPPLPELSHTPPTALPATREIVLEDLTYSYPGAEGAGVRGVSLTIPIGSTLGIVGTTGAGKTTLVDLLLGLLTPQEGRVRADGVAVTPDNIRAWQAGLGYVPQDIFLTDASIAENIALGVPRDQIDADRVRDCARMAQILDHIDTALPDGIDTTVGERGVRLSGGQRQRLGIARALYHDPGVLIFDEATSALDNLTEKEVIRAVDALSGSKTVIMIAHRMSTVRACAQIALLDKGRLVGLGSYDELYRDNAAFRRMADPRNAA